MKAIETSSWKSFLMKDIFEMRNTKSIIATNLVPDSGRVPYVTSQEGNNGVQMYVDCPEEWLDAGGCIMIGGKTLSFSYQEYDFCSNDSHNIALYSKDPCSKSEICQLFLISALRSSLESTYSWGDSISMKRVKDESFMLPVTSLGEPDWDYMEQTMREVKEKQDDALDVLVAVIGTSSSEIDTSSWGEFRIGDLFDVVKGSRLRSLDRFEGDIPYLGASLFNNGYTHMISNDEHIHPGNVLTTAYNGTVPGKTFYQPIPFWATDDVNVLYPKFEMTVESGLFIAPLIEVVGKNYVYVDKWKLQDMIDAVIFLPVTSEGDPNWGSMEQTMREVLAERETALDSLQALVPEA